MAISDYLRQLRTKVGHDLLHVPAVTGIVINEAGEVLLHRSRDDGNWYLIGGAMDPGEEPAEAVVREVREETGLIVVPERIVDVHSSPLVVYPNQDRVIYVGVAFRCRPVGGELRVADDESLEVKYFPADKLPTTLPEHHRRCVKCTFEAREAAVFVPPRGNLQ